MSLRTDNIPVWGNQSWQDSPDDFSLKMLLEDAAGRITHYVIKVMRQIVALLEDRSRESRKTSAYDRNISK